MVHDHGTQYEENPASHHGGMREDGLTGRRTDSFRTFPDSGLGGSGNNKDHLAFHNELKITPPNQLIIVM